MNDMFDLCRICLDSGAKYPLFERSESEDCNLLTRLTLCLKEKIEDVDGYPRCICENCNDAIETICRFISKYRETSQILKNGLLVVKDESCFQGEVPIEINNIKKEPGSDDILLNNPNVLEESLPLIQLKLKEESKCVIKTTKRKCPQKLTLKAKSTKNDINKIASSILEGDFAWIGDVWCMKSSKQNDLQEKKVRSHKQNELKIIMPKEPRAPQPPPARLCDLCGEIFKHQDRLNVHKKKVHYKEKPIQCPHCPRVLVSQYYLNRHLKRRHDTEGKSFTCQTCGRGFAFKGELTTHIKNVHNKHLKPKKMYTCKICNKTYKCAKSVLVHERSVHTGLRPAVCQICGTSFFHDDYLKEHMRLHTGETPFKCPICGRGYAQRCNMKSHLRIHRISDIDATTLSKLRPNYLKLLKV